LALYQANKVKDELQKKYPQHQFDIKIIHTKGDIVLDVALS
jgi:hydroxymethylbilane synthase